MASKKKVTNIITYVVLVLISIIWLLPFVCLVLQSFRSYNEMGGGMVDYVIPKKFHWIPISSSLTRAAIS